MLPDTATLHVFYGTLPLLLAAVIAIWNNNKRLDDLRSEMHEGFRDVKDRLGKLEDRVSDLEKGLRLVKN